MAERRNWFSSRYTDCDDEPLCDILHPHFGQVSTVSLEESLEYLWYLFFLLENNLWICKRKCSNPLNGLSEDESASIHLFRMEFDCGPSLYQLLNKALRDVNQQSLNVWNHFLKLILTGLNKIPSSSQIVWRGSSQQNLCSKYPIGKQFRWWGLTRCTPERDTIEKDIHVGQTGVRTLFSIQSRNGKLINQYSDGEDEMIFMPGAFFQVIDQTNPSKDLFIIYLQEIPPPNDDPPWWQTTQPIVTQKNFDGYDGNLYDALREYHNSHTKSFESGPTPQLPGLVTPPLSISKHIEPIPRSEVSNYLTNTRIEKNQTTRISRIDDRKAISAINKEILPKSIIDKCLPYWSQWATFISSLGTQPADIEIGNMIKKEQDLEQILRTVPYDNERNHRKIDLLKHREKRLQIQIGSLLNYSNLSQEDVHLIEASIGDKETNLMTKIEQIKQQEINLSDEIEQMMFTKNQLLKQIQWIQSKIDQGEEYPKGTLPLSLFHPTIFANPQSWKQILFKHQMRLNELYQQIQKRQNKLNELYSKRRTNESELEHLFKDIKLTNGSYHQVIRLNINSHGYQICRKDLLETRAERLTYEIEQLISSIQFLKLQVQLTNDQEKKFKLKIKYRELLSQFVSKRNNLIDLLREDVSLSFPPHQIDHLLRLLESCFTQITLSPTHDNRTAQALENSILINSIKYDILICCVDHHDIIQRITNAFPQQYSFHIKDCSSTENIRIILDMTTIAVIAIINNEYQSNPNCEADIKYIFKRQFTLVLVILDEQFQPNTNWLNHVFRAPSTQKVYLNSTDFDQNLRDATENARWNSPISKRINFRSDNQSEDLSGDFHQWNIIASYSTSFECDYRKDLHNPSSINENTLLQDFHYEYVCKYFSHPMVQELSKRSFIENDMHPFIEAYTRQDKFSDTLNHHLSAYIIFFFQSELNDSIDYQLVKSLVDIVTLSIYRQELYLLESFIEE